MMNEGQNTMGLVHQIGLQIGATIAAKNLIDEKLVSDRTLAADVRASLESEHERLGRVLESLEGAAASQPAETLSGAMLHLFLVLGSVSLIEGNVDDATRKRLQPFIDRANAGLESAVSVLAKQPGVSPGEYGGTYYAGLE